MPKATKEQIEGWKKQHGSVYEISTKDAVCYIRSPQRKDLSHATTVAGNDPFKFNEVIMKDCWLFGDDSMINDIDKFLGVSEQLGDIIEKAETKLKKL